MGILISPSILNCDMGDLKGELAAISDADWVHVDVMDNHFVPNLTWGTPIIEAAARYSPVPIDAHLMIDSPEKWAPSFIEAGASSATFHAEAATEPVRLAREIRAMGGRAGLALNPNTPIEDYEEILGEFDMILCMTVEPGFGGQGFLAHVLPKVERAKQIAIDKGLDYWVQVDGGITAENIARVVEAGATNIVAGSAVYRAEVPNDAIAGLRSACGHKSSSAAAPK